MKMRVIFAGLLLGTAAALYAQVTVGGSVDMSIVPFQLVQGDEYEDAYGNTNRHPNTMGAGMGGVLHGGNAPRIRLDMRAVNADHRIGMRVRLQALAPTQGANVGVENFLQAWWSPLEWLRIDAGRFDDDRLRGRIGWDEMGMFTNMMFNQDQIFSRIRVRNGLMLSATPVEGLLLAGALRELVQFSPGTNNPGDVSQVNPDHRHQNGNAWRNMTFALGYTIADIGTIRVQYIGDVLPAGAPGITKDNDLELAFALTAIDSLLLDLGAKLHFVYAMDDPNFAFSLGARFRADALELIGRVDTQIGRVVPGTAPAEYQNSNNLFRLNAHIWPSFQLDAARVVLNFGIDYMEMPGNEDNRTDLGVGVSLQRNFFGNSRVRGGLALAIPTDSSRGMTFTVPLFLDWTF